MRITLPASFLSVFLASFALASAARADEAAPKIALGADAALEVPVGNFSSATPVGLGALGVFRYRVIPKLDITGRTGLLVFVPKSGGVTLVDWPVLGGVAFRPLADDASASFSKDAADGFDVAAELGPNMLFATQGGGSRTSIATRVTAGYSWPSITVRGGFVVNDLGYAGDTFALTASVGTTFARF